MASKKSKKNTVKNTKLPVVEKQQTLLGQIRADLDNEIELLKVKEPGTLMVSENEKVRDYVLTTPAFVHLYLKPDTISRVLGTFAKGTRLEVLPSNDNFWVKVQTTEEPRIQGYVRNVYVSKENT